MDIIKELEDLKGYIAGLARTDQIYCTMPPQHGFAAGATVEGVLSKIDLIEERIKEETEKNKSITCDALIEFIKSYVSFGGPCTDEFIKGLYNYINIVKTEITLLKIQSQANRCRLKWINFWEKRIINKK